MQIELSGHHVEITDGIREAVSSKLTKVKSHHPNIDKLNVVLTVESHTQTIEISTNYMGKPLSVSASDKEMYAAIAAAGKKLDASLSHKKGTVKANRHEKASFAEEE